jgi:hypothetical protein
MNNRALMIAFHFPPQAGSSGIQRTLSFSRHLGAHDWEPLILSATPAAYEQKNSSQLAMLPADLVLKRAYALDGKRHFGLRGRYPEIIALPDRWISWWFSAVPTGMSMIRRHKATAIWSTFPIATAHLVGMTLQRLTGLPWIADFRDPMVQIDFPATSRQRRAYQWIEQRAIIRCTKAVFTTQSTLANYKQRFPSFLHQKFVVIENGYDEDVFKGIASHSPHSTSESGSPLTLLHSGVLYPEGRDPSAFFEAVSQLKIRGTIDRQSLCIILRAPGDIPYFKSLAEKYHVADVVKVEPPLTYREAVSEMMAVDGLLVFQGSPFNTQVPAKIYEYFRARKPIFGLVDPTGETARVLCAAGFHDLVPMACATAIALRLADFISQTRQGTAKIASDDVIFASSRKHRASELARVLDEIQAGTKKV